MRLLGEAHHAIEDPRAGDGCHGRDKQRVLAATSQVDFGDFGRAICETGVVPFLPTRGNVDIRSDVSDALCKKEGFRVLGRRLMVYMRPRSKVLRTRWPFERRATFPIRVWLGNW